MSRPDPKSASAKPTINWDVYRQILAIGVVCCCFWAMHHSFTLTPEAVFMESFEDGEHRTVDRVENLNRLSALGRVTLACFGIACLVFPTRQRISYGSVLFVTIVAGLGFTFLSVLWSTYPSLTLKKQIVLGLFMLSALGLARQFSLRELAVILVVTSLIQICGGYLVELVKGQFLPYKSGYRFIGTSHPNTNAVMATICCLGAGFFTKSGEKFNTLTKCIFIFGLLTIWLTKSRTTLAALFVAIFFVRYVTLPPRSRTILSSSVALLIVLGAAIIALSPRYVHTAILEKLAMGRTQDVSSLTGRLPLWEELMESVGERPWLGHGYLAFWNKRQIEELGDELGWEIPHGHNLYLDILLDGGLVGLLLLLVFYWIAIQTGITDYRKSRDPGVALVIGMLAFCVIHGFGESLFKLPTFMSLALAVLVFRLSLRLENSVSWVRPRPHTSSAESAKRAIAC